MSLGNNQQLNGNFTKKKKNTVRTGVAILIANVSAVGSCDDFMDADMQTIRRLKVDIVHIKHLFCGEESAF